MRWHHRASQCTSAPDCQIPRCWYNSNSQASHGTIWRSIHTCRTWSFETWWISFPVFPLSFFSFDIKIAAAIMQPMHRTIWTAPQKPLLSNLSKKPHTFSILPIVWFIKTFYDDTKKTLELLQNNLHGFCTINSKSYNTIN